MMKLVNDFQPSTILAKKRHIFLTAIWLSHGQLWAILERTASLTQLQSLHFLQFRFEGHRELCSEFGSLSPTKRLVGFETETIRFQL